MFILTHGGVILSFSFLLAGFLPLPPGIPIGVVVQSYAGTISLSVTSEKWAVPDADKFLRWTLDEYNRLSEEATELEKNRALAKP